MSDALRLIEQAVEERKQAETNLRQISLLLGLTIAQGEPGDDGTWEQEFAANEVQRAKLNVEIRPTGTGIKVVVREDGHP